MNSSPAPEGSAAHRDAPASQHSRKHWWTIGLALALLVACELALQVRSQLRFGSSVFNLLQAETTYSTDTQTGLKLLRPNAKIEGTQATIESNALGLRSPPISAVKPAGRIRLAVVGASSVMGTYTRDNNDTLPYQLQGLLDDYYGRGTIEVINAGIAGFSLADQTVMINDILLPLSVDALLLYPGFNDVGGYCSAGEAGTSPSHALNSVQAPSWLLLVELITKNTVGLRQLRAGGAAHLDPATLDTSTYAASLAALFDSVNRAALPMLVVTNPRAYRTDMPLATQKALAATALYYNPCFDIDGLNELFDSHNALLALGATEAGFNVFPLDKLMPGGSRYFGDATHFSTEGTAHAAQLLREPVLSLLDPLVARLGENTP